MPLYFERDGWESDGEPGTPLVLVAGLATDLVSWTLQREALNGTRPVLVFDHRGIGRSPESSVPFSIEDLAEDLHRLLDELGAGPVDLLGHSMGGAVVQTFLRRYPNRARRAVLACSFAKPSKKMELIAQGWVDALFRRVSADELAQTLFPWLYTEQFLEKHYQVCLDALTAHPYPLDPQTVMAQHQAMAAFDSRDWLKELRHPIMVLSAERDLLVEPNHGEQLSSGLRNARSATVPGGHSCMLESPGPFLQCALDFLDQA